MPTPLVRAATGWTLLRPGKARNKIRQFFKNQDKELINRGRVTS